MSMSARTRFAAITVAAVIALGSGGCTADAAPEPTRSPSSVSTPSPSATTTLGTPAPTPTPTSTAAYDPDDVSTWQITYSGIGPVQLDRPVADILAEVPSGETSCRPGVASFFGSEVVAVGDGTASDLVKTATTGGAPEQLDASTAPTTDAGIAAGSSFEQLLTAYPDAEPYSDSNGRPGYRLTDGSSWIHFTSVDGSTIDGIDVSRSPGDLKEYCG